MKHLSLYSCYLAKSDETHQQSAVRSGVTQRADPLKIQSIPPLATICISTMGHYELDKKNEVRLTHAYIGRNTASETLVIYGPQFILVFLGHFVVAPGSSSVKLFLLHKPACFKISMAIFTLQIAC